MFALARIGAVHVPVNTRFRVDDLAYVLRQSEATTLLTHDVSGPSTTSPWLARWGPHAVVLVRSAALRRCAGS